VAAMGTDPVTCAGSTAGIWSVPGADGSTGGCWSSPGAAETAEVADGVHDDLLRLAA
jgi:hypothetical protein